MRASVIICALLVAAIAGLAPHRIGQDPVPWHTHFKEQYANAEYAKIGIQVYKIGKTSRLISASTKHLNHTTGLVDERYYFVRCGIKEPLLLSINKPEDQALLYNIRFSKKGEPTYERFDMYYKEKCYAPLAPIYMRYKEFTEWWKTL